LVVDYLNANQIDYLWHPKSFEMDNGRHYTPDCYLPEGRVWIDIRGHFWKDAREKWDWFHARYPNSELWNKEKLKEYKIL
jgi:hypothetical protein